LCHYNQITYKIWEGFGSKFLRLSQVLLPVKLKPARGILKGGAYGSQEKGQEESQKEKEVTFVLM
jgi:hypothetical protein